MKKIIIILIFLVTTIVSSAYGDNAAPYTDEAIQNVFKAMKDLPKEEYDKEQTGEDNLKQLISYFNKVYEMAGYNLGDTINRIVDDMQNNPAAIPVDQQSVYSQLYMLILVTMYECDPENEKSECLDYFPPETHPSITWFMENNDFSKQNKNKAH